MAMKVLVFGAGKNAGKALFCLKEDVEVVGFLDNDATKWGNDCEGIEIISPAEGIQKSFDYIVISVERGYGAIAEQMKGYGVEEGKIIPLFSYEHSRYRKWRQVVLIEELIYLEMNRKVEELSAYVENIEYEMAAKLEKGELVFPKILGEKETVHEIVTNGKSISRYGDGEMELARGGSIPFQKADMGLQKRLKEILVSNLSNHIVAIRDVYGALPNCVGKSFYRQYFSSGVREQEYAMLDMGKAYYDAYITRPYMHYADKSGTKERFMRLKTIWEGRELTIVEGEKTRFGMGNNLLSNACSVIRILCPAENAFDRYAAILEAVEETDRKRLVLIALGPTATVLAYDLAKLGYQAVDIGHVDIEYEWFLRDTTEKIAIPGKYVNEVSGGRNITDEIVDSQYKNEIWKIIS